MYVLLWLVSSWTVLTRRWAISVIHGEPHIILYIPSALIATSQMSTSEEYSAKMKTYRLALIAEFYNKMKITYLAYDVFIIYNR